jgi:hypothetical protein
MALPATNDKRRTEDFESVAGDAGDQIAMVRRNEVQPLLGSHPMRFVPGFIEVTAKLDDPRSERGDRGVLIGRVAKGEIDGGAQSSAQRRKGNRLPVIPASCRNHPFDVCVRLTQAMQVYQAAAYLERASRRVILVLDVDLATGARAQFGPRMERRRRDDLVNQIGRPLAPARPAIPRWSRHSSGRTTHRWIAVSPTALPAEDRLRCCAH